MRPPNVPSQAFESRQGLMFLLLQNKELKAWDREGPFLGGTSPSCLLSSILVVSDGARAGELVYWLSLYLTKKE